MRGQVLGVDLRSGDGQIAGDDGRRYVFRPTDWGDRIEPAVGALVDFETEQNRATSIYHIPGAAPAGRHVVADPAANAHNRSRYVAAALAFFLGTLGIHRFYLGRTGSGIVMLLLTCTVVGLLVTGPWAFVDMVRYLVMSEAEFAARYARHPR